ncbi:MAG: response regulator [Syntrophobacteraceae bacterium]|jgi:signal transduction histidine kinase|nr:response regulator [Syntrophobacteraceae bacterium]
MPGKILIVDDEGGVRKVLSLSLEAAGYQVFTAANAPDALDEVARVLPEIVLADIRMPGMDGIELLRRIKSEHADTEVIMMTGHAELDLAVRSLQHEAADFITKPISYAALEVALNRVREKAWMRAQLREYTENLERLVEEKTNRLIEAERMAAIGQTVAAIAHGVKNIIGGLTGGMYVLERGIELHDRRYLLQGWQMIKRNVQKIKTLMLDLLRFAKDREPEYDLCDPNIPAREVYHLMAARARQCGAELKLDLDPGLGRVVLDPEGIYTCLLNLVTNAVDACCNGDACGEGPREVVLASGPRDGWAVEYRVKDNGSGMDPETRSQIFRGFFSTKGTKGTGLGLMVTEKIVREHGGTIQVESEPGRGTLFVIRLPVREIDEGEAG